jgi:HK97 family phage major capsid protein
MPPIKTMEALDEFATEVKTDQEQLKVTVATIDAAMKEAAKASAEYIAGIKAEVEVFKDKLGSLQTLVKSQDAIMQTTDTETLECWKMGKMTQLLIRNHLGMTSKGDHATMMKLGCIPTRLAPKADVGPIDIVKGYEERYKSRMLNAINGKAAVSDDPLTSDDSDETGFLGSYLVPVDTNAAVMRVAADASAMMGRVTTMPVRGITTYLPTTTDAFAFTAVTDQETAKTEETLSFGRATLTVVTYALWIAITEEVDEDSLVSLGALIRQLSAEAWAAKFDSMCLEDATYGALANAGNNVAMGGGDTTFGSITTAYLDAMIAKLTTRAARRGASFFMHPTVWDTLVNEVDADGNYKIRRFADDAPLMARGYPVVLTDGMPALADTAVSTKFVAFGNPAYIVNGTKVGFEFRIFNETYGTMQYDQIYLRARLRQAFVLWATAAWVSLTTAAA